uniref:Botcinic acid biosynthesis cluster B protein 14 n=1 Tax=Botryotinia fuckeliana (strain B05.10) TaxID=332648 RepID=BOA14_BOTFB|nr:RecName: Full=Botcinic acid biosynthesis cluster B protein 14 [Botrytis cinerea B05.10]CBX87037.1 hypothetical protein [Botrytis cinerea B05.10]
MEVSARVRVLMQHALHTIERRYKQVLLLIQQLSQHGIQSYSISPFHIHCIYSCYSL